MAKTQKDLIDRYELINKIYSNQPIQSPIIPGARIYKTKNNKFVTLKMLEQQISSAKNLKISKTQKLISLPSEMEEIVQSRSYRILQRKCNEMKQRFQNDKKKLSKELKKLDKQIKTQEEKTNLIYNRLIDHEQKISKLKQNYYEIRRKNYELECELDYRMGESQNQNSYEETNSIINVDEMTYEQLLRMEERIGSINVGLPSCQIAKIPTRKMEDLMNKNDKVETLCCICYEQINKSERIIELECEHIHHVHCIRQWLKIKRFCPLCKHQVTINQKK